MRTALEPVAVDCSCSHVFLATKSCTIEAYTCTDAEPTIVGEFSTIHPVQKLVYTAKGDCLVTSEAKDSRSPSQARVYFNWLGATKKAGVRPRPAHAASTQSYVTPRGHHQKQPSVEVVELGFQSGSPGQGKGLCIGSCGTSGIIGVASGYDIRLYVLQQIVPSASDGTANGSHGNMCYDVTVFADITLGFEIRSLSLSHNYLAAMSPQEVHVLKWQVSGVAHLAFHSPFLHEDDAVDGGAVNDTETTESTFIKDPHCIVWSAQTTGEISATSSRPGSRVGSRAPSPVLGASTLDVHSSTGSSIPISSCGPSPSGMGVITLKKVAKAARQRPDSHIKQPREVLGPMDHIRGVPASFVYRSQARGRVEASLFTLLYKCDPVEGAKGDTGRMSFLSTHLMPVTVNGEGPREDLCLVVGNVFVFVVY